MPISTRARFTAPPTVPYSPRDSFSDSGDEEDVMFRTSYDSRSSSGSPLPTDAANRVQSRVHALVPYASVVHEVGTASSTRSGSETPSPTDAANHVQSRVHALVPYASVVHEAGATDFARSGSGSPPESEFSEESAQDDRMDWQPEGQTWSMEEDVIPMDWEYTDDPMDWEWDD
ncbi:hypothetical protein DFQ28_010952 [Apophysomyces sp. BC1034]|nr:hypothetical protein DFQ30_010201 [Apophysomyces sp. BC1015]KAG0170070.1 hypothetical protein DFQ29_009467 [Apophysomyces sp. BC1021]KAG0184538.1 hypothetical protein DFQ28_010952 [Apophysomyces sp. BC1034]